MQVTSADLSAFSVDAKLLYCRVLVSLALADALLDPREIANLYLFASTIGLDGEARSELRSEITGAQRDAGVPDATVELSRELHDLLEEDQREPVFTVLVRDLVRISRADRHAADAARDQRLRPRRGGNHLGSGGPGVRRPAGPERDGTGSARW
ncbi:hypothetical protein Pth03_59960 [Planotetraspora thailandica]|uniref:Uncharacterized protein n=1 Tax=Planotetraspora thailandica TaxID=487172 RepID=A0A8J3XWG9_9ACTN|nr:hypothetical protein [Planotetraspora thailandica]GII57607.1 hypothetical protein Pth03_59960 [Planotetraspora thailandica]